MFSAGLDNRVMMWDPFDFTPLQTLRVTGSEMSTMTFHTSWGILITGT
jgi:hypothetical protein